MNLPKQFLGFRDGSGDRKYLLPLYWIDPAGNAGEHLRNCQFLRPSDLPTLPTDADSRFQSCCVCTGITMVNRTAQRGGSSSAAAVNNDWAPLIEQRARQTGPSEREQMRDPTRSNTAEGTPSGRLGPRKPNEIGRKVTQGGRRKKTIRGLLESCPTPNHHR